ncbi:perilipin-1-like [Linepithema humile]|uniref:perilipin-1-like n=1 Tax=Linepithema humile TaxID=83485 RepID=UPI00062365FC|nr:PREDICTED: perilipin-1-like [Linepithema humile]
MTGSEASHEISERSSSIVRIAYHQLSIIYGIHDPTAPVNVTSVDTDVNAHSMVCTCRLLGLPIFATVRSAFSNAYSVVKDSHESVAFVLGGAEDGMRAGLDFASPVTNRIADTLETPLKYVDNAVCVGLDFVEEKMPSVKLPPGEIYENMKDSFRNIFTKALETLRLLFGEPKNQIEGLSVASETTQEEIRKVSS